jgi:alkyl sulfatase BDS1-like metallo-beta-lactamase superfamily hydrolase
MGDELIELADRVWRGEEAIEEHHPVGFQGGLAEVAEGVAFLASMANISAFQTGEGLVLVDTGGYMLAPWALEQVREWSQEPFHTAIYTHGHVDHVFGFLDNDSVHVVAHENVPKRFDRYRLTAGYNSWINRRQFGLDEFDWPTQYRYPDQTYSSSLELDVGGVRFELHHAKGETDDATWVWVPDRRVLCSGDLIIWATPNAGNPQKAQRYPREWAHALREMAAKEAEVLLPGHGLPVVGAERVQTILSDTADLLESIVSQALEAMNSGARLDAVVRSVKPPPELLGKPWLKPIYDEPEFIVRNIWRLYGGWYDGNPATLKPASEAALALEVASLAGGVAALAARAREVAEAGDLRLAGHLAEWAALADDAQHDVRAEVFGKLAAREASTMARGVFGFAARESSERSA